MSSKLHSVMLADDHELFTEGIRLLLETRYDVKRIVTDGRELLEAAEKERPDVVLCDISMPGLSGIEATRSLNEAVPETAVIILTMHEEASYCQAAFEAGAKGYLLKSSAPQELLEAIRQVLEGRHYASPSMAGKLMSRRAKPGEERERKSVLTARESEISRLVAEGLETSEIAGRLGIAEVTVRTHYSRILRKLGLRNRLELTRYVLKRGL